MKSLLQSLLLGCALLACGQSYAQQTAAAPRLSPYTRMLAANAASDARNGACPSCRALSDGNRYVPVLLKVSDAAEAEASLRDAGARIGTRAGLVWTAQLPFAALAQTPKLRGIRYIEAGEPAEPALQQARLKTRTDSVHRGIGLPMRYFGAGVMMGVIDFGFDYNHPSFYDTLGAAYRVRKVWELNTTGTPPAGYAYGHEITDSNAIRAQGTDNAEQTHGTATAGMAGGGGWMGLPTNKLYRGFAPMTDLVMVGVRRDTIGDQWLQGTFPDFVDAIAYIFQQADAAGQPCVINISWGSQSGPHNGTTLFNEAVNGLCGPGRLVVMSAGNEGEERIHLKKTFAAGDSLLSTFVTFNSYGDSIYHRTWVDGWGQPGKSVCASVSLWHNGGVVSTTGFQCIDDADHPFSIIGSNGADSCVGRFITSSAEYNGQPRLTVDLHHRTADTAFADSVLVTFKSTDGGAWDLWDEYYFFGYKYGYSSAFDSLGMPWARRGDTLSTVSDMGSGDSVLLVGAYASKTDWTSMFGGSYSYSGYVGNNKLVPFSSRGPLANGVTKPDITAPGVTIATAMSSYDTAYGPGGTNAPYTVARVINSANDTFYYSEFTGTSASAPAASGIVALMLQVKPNLSVQEMKNVLFATAIKDSHTGALPPDGHNGWGHGKINAYGAIKALLQSTSVVEASGAQAPDCVLFPNPATGGAFTLDYTGAEAEKLTVSVSDLAGRILQTFDWAVSAGHSQRALNLGGLPVGAYIVRIAGARGATGLKAVVR